VPRLPHRAADEFRLEAHRAEVVDLAVDVVIAVDEADVLDLGALLDAAASVFLHEFGKHDKAWGLRIALDGDPIDAFDLGRLGRALAGIALVLIRHLDPAPVAQVAHQAIEHRGGEPASTLLIDRFPWREIMRQPPPATVGSACRPRCGRRIDADEIQAACLLDKKLAPAAESRNENVEMTRCADAKILFVLLIQNTMVF
jgi:hypothetical protein